jgi:hypothetical protein
MPVAIKANQAATKAAYLVSLAAFPFTGIHPATTKATLV